MKNRIQEFREKRQWRQKDLAEMLKVSRQTIISIESGRYNPSLELAFKIGQIFNEPIEKIFLFDYEP